MRQYCTLFDSKYLSQGLALYESLSKHSSEDFELNILAMDEECHNALASLRLPDRVQIWGLSEMPTYPMKENRTWREFCWTMASQFADRLMSWLNIESITYLDADLFFFSDPAPVFKEIGSRSIAITPHQFPDNKEKPRLLKSGLFNVGFVHFKNTPAGRSCLSKWAAQVRERCSAEVGCGDQCYLDSWPQEFGDEVAVLGIGVNMGPWNLSAHDVSLRDGKVHLGEHPLIAYHFHEYKHGERMTNYPLRQQDIALVYRPYIDAINRAQERIANLALTSQ